MKIEEFQRVSGKSAPGRTISPKVAESLRKRAERTPMSRPAGQRESEGTRLAATSSKHRALVVEQP